VQWGVEHIFNQHYSHLPQWKCVSGYIGGDTSNPSESAISFGTIGPSCPGTGDGSMLWHA
jgi:peptide-methionine (S)-S-oxide reductase